MSKVLKWYEVYYALAKSMKSFYNKHGEHSGQRLYELISEQQDEAIALFPFMEKFFKETGVKSFDPVHIFASFNYYNISAEKRRQKIRFFSEIFNMTSNKFNNVDYDVFDYFPHINIVHIVARREALSQKQIWKFFVAIMNNDDRVIKEHFDYSAKDWYGIQVPALTIFMFWVKSNKYMPLDKNTVQFLESSNIFSKTSQNYEEYMQLNNRMVGLGDDICRNIAHMAIAKENNLTEYAKLEIKQFIKVNNFEDIQNIEKRFQTDVEKSKKDSTEARRKRLKNVKSTKPMKTTAITVVYLRNSDVVAEVLFRANGVCEFCNHKAPFLKQNGEPYLEVHHIVPLSKDGHDIVENALALCPNCHKEAHFGSEKNKFKS